MNITAPKEKLSITIADHFSKEMIDKEADRIIELARSGDISSLQLHLAIKAMEKVIEKITKNNEYRESVENEIALYGKDNHAYGARFEKRSRRSFIFKDDKLQIINAKISGLNSEKKSREEYLKTITEPIVDSDTGEVINPPEIMVTESVYITFDKE